MALSIRNSSEPINIDDKVVYEYFPVRVSILGIPASAKLPTLTYIATRPIRIPKPPAIELPEADLDRALNYYADYGGCGHWRMAWPEAAMNIYNKACMTNLTSMVLDVRFYQGVKAIKFQRQATPVQAEFFNCLVKLREESKAKNSQDHSYRLIYEVDDVVFADDIPDYNRCKEAFADKETEKFIMEIMKGSDEITVTTPYIKDYYIKKTGNQKVTVVPNYAPKNWLGRYYDPKRVAALYEQFQKRPRVLYAGSGTHVDVANKTGLKDDFAHITREIIQARKKFRFVWQGSYPLAMKPFVENGEMEFIDWANLHDHPKALYNASCNMAFASLTDNIFNRCKSDIKILEYGAMGMPSAFQDMCTYENAEVRFTNGADLIAKLEWMHQDFDRYMKLSQNIYNYVDSRWLEDHLDVIKASYFTEWGSKERAFMSPELISLNPDQKIGNGL